MLGSSRIVAVSVSYMPYSNIYGQRLFIVALRELQCLQCCLQVDILRIITSPCFVCLHFLVSEIAKCIARRCLLLFTRITLFTTVFTKIIFVYSLKRSCIARFTLTSCCISELLSESL